MGITIQYEYLRTLHSNIIGVTKLTERHDAIFIGQQLQLILNDWNVKDDKIVPIVTDNGANIKKAVKDTFGEIQQIPCFAHTLNLVPQDTLKKCPEVTELCGKVKKIVTFFKHSTIATNELRKSTVLKLIQSVETRWNSTYYMLERFISVSKEVGSVLLDLLGFSCNVDGSRIAISY